MRDHMRTELALSALMMAPLAATARTGSHSPLRQGKPIRRGGLRRATRQGRRRAVHEPHRQLPRSSHRGATGPSPMARAPRESVFHTLKVELVHQHRGATRDLARRHLFASVEGCHNRARIHSALGYLTPEQAEQMASQPRVHRDRGRSDPPDPDPDPPQSPPGAMDDPGRGSPPAPRPATRSRTPPSASDHRSGALGADATDDVERQARMGCLKLPGERLMARDFDRQTSDLHIRAALLNRFTRPGAPETQRVA